MAWWSAWGVGDGGKFFYLQDLIVAPSRQREGIDATFGGLTGMAQVRGG